MNDVSEKYKNMLDSFECDFDLILDNSYGITWFNQMIKRIKNKDKLMKEDEQFLKDLDLLSELSFNLRHGYCKIVENMQSDKQ